VLSQFDVRSWLETRHATALCVLPSALTSPLAAPGNHVPSDRVRACAVVDGQPALELGSLEDIRSATKGGMDPSGAPGCPPVSTFDTRHVLMTQLPVVNGC